MNSLPSFPSPGKHRTRSTHPLGSSPHRPWILAEKLKHSLTQRFTSEFRGRVHDALIRRALGDAFEVADGTGFPLLFLPALVEEKMRPVSEIVGDLRFAGSSLALRHAA